MSDVNFNIKLGNFGTVANFNKCIFVYNFKTYQHEKSNFIVCACGCLRKL